MFENNPLTRVGKDTPTIQRGHSRALEMVRPGGNIAALRGAVAQLGERCVRNAEVGSSTLLGSTILLQKY